MAPQVHAGAKPVRARPFANLPYNPTISASIKTRRHSTRLYPERLDLCHDPGTMEIRHLRYFLAVADELYFTRAAALLHVAQPALSHQIRQLEKEIGVQFLERTKRRVRLTSAGEIFRNRARVVVEQAARAAVEAARIGRGSAGTVSIGVGSTRIWIVLPELVRRFRQIARAVTIDIREMEPSDQLEALWHEATDVALMAANPRDPELESILILRERLVAALPARHPASSRRRVNLKSLAGDTLVLPGRLAMPGFNEIVIGAFERAGAVPAETLTTRLIQTLICLVAGRLGVALVPESFGRNMRVKGVAYRPICEPVAVAELNAVGTPISHYRSGTDLA